MGFEPMNTGFADQRVSHFATGALVAAKSILRRATNKKCSFLLDGIKSTSAVRPCGDTASPFYTQERSYRHLRWRPLP
jgi:hypothetical protein